MFVECLQKNVEEKQNEVDSWTARAQREHNEMTELKRRLLETERSKSVVESKVIKKWWVQICNSIFFSS